MNEKIRIPIPDPLGILGDVTRDMPVVLYDPLQAAREIQAEIQAETETAQQPEVREKEKGYIESKIDNYTYHLEKALEYAPCPGCRALVISALVGVEIYRRMEEQGMKREEFTEEEIQKIKREIEEKYSG